jgi:hypothetical protein
MGKLCDMAEGGMVTALHISHYMSLSQHIGHNAVLLNWKRPAFMLCLWAFVIFLCPIKA